MTDKPIPKTLGACADELYKVREKRYAIQKQVDELKKRESQLREHIINTLPKSDAKGIAGKVCRVTITKKEVPTVKDWDLLYPYIKRNWNKGAMALVQKRLAESAVKEIWASGKKVPGVEAFTAVDLSINKL